MADATQSEKPDKLSDWVKTHKKAVYGFLIVIGAIFFFIFIRARSSSTSSTNSPNGSAVTTPTGTTSPYYGGGEYGGGYATSNNFGQIESQLANINSAIAALTPSQSQSSTTSPTGSTAGSGSNSDNGGTRYGTYRQNDSVVPGGTLLGLTYSQAAQQLQGSGWKITNINGGPVDTGNNGKIVSYTPYSYSPSPSSGGTIRIGV